MDHIGSLLGRSDLTQTPKNYSVTSQEQETRRRMVEAQIKRMAFSQGLEMPSPTRLALLVSDALRLWTEIPTAMIPNAVDEGLIAAGTYPWNAGIVAKAWRAARAERKVELGTGRMSEKESRDYLEWLEAQGKIADEERRAGFEFKPPVIV